jgi:O-antigen ligase
MRQYDTSGAVSSTFGNGELASSARSALDNTNARTQRTFKDLRALAADSLIVSILSPFLALSSPIFQKTLLAVVILNIPFELGTHLFYNERLANLGAMGGLSISAATIALAGLYGAWLIRTLTAKQREPRRPFHLSVSLLVYLFFIGISVLVAQDTSLAVFEACLFLESFLMYTYVANTVQTRRDVQFVLGLLFAGGLVEALTMVILRFTGMPSTVWGIPAHIHIESAGTQGFMRIGGTVGSPNTAGAYLSVVLAIAVGVLFTNLGRAYKLLAGSFLAFGGAALVLTFSRGAWIALVLSLFLFCLLVVRRRGLSIRVPIVIFLMLTLLYLPFHHVIAARLFGNDNGSAESRIPLMHLAIRIFEAHPLLGVGANNFPVAMYGYLTPEFRHGFLYAVHNLYLLVLCETGIGGLAAFLAFLIAALRRAWRCWKLNDSLLSPIALGLFVAFVGYMVNMNFELFRGRPMQQLIWLMAALLAAVEGMIGRPSLSKQPSPA